jgi:CheY-like chemotaxis protein
MRAAPEGSPIPVTRQRILLVDDDPGVRLDLQAILRADGYEVEAAESCRVARDRFRSSRPDAVIASCRLPDGSALDLLPLVKAAGQQRSAVAGSSVAGVSVEASVRPVAPEGVRPTLIWTGKSGDDFTERRVPGHSECDLQLD